MEKPSDHAKKQLSDFVSQTGGEIIAADKGQKFREYHSKCEVLGVIWEPRTPGLYDRGWRALSGAEIDKKLKSKAICAGLARFD